MHRQNSNPWSPNACLLKSVYATVSTCLTKKTSPGCVSHRRECLCVKEKFGRIELSITVLFGLDALSEVSQTYTQMHIRTQWERPLSRETGSEQHAGWWPSILVLLERAERERERGLDADLGNGSLSWHILDLAESLVLRGWSLWNGDKGPPWPQFPVNHALHPLLLLKCSKYLHHHICFHTRQWYLCLCTSWIWSN